MSSHKTVAFFGATGGSTAPCLAACLKAGYTCTALARDSSKLTSLLEKDHAVSSDLISKHLTIVNGDVRDPAAVSQVLFPAVLNTSSPDSGTIAVDMIVSGIGCYPVRKPGTLIPTQEDPTLCQDAISTILGALQTRRATKKPGLVVLSTTGVSKYGRDYPLLTWPIYGFLLETAHNDKKAMEKLATESVKAEPALIDSYYIVRASLLTNGVAKGVDSVRWEVEEDSMTNKAIGYSISRADVGGFVFEKVVEPFATGKAEGTGKVFRITH